MTGVPARKRLYLKHFIARRLRDGQSVRTFKADRNGNKPILRNGDHTMQTSKTVLSDKSRRRVIDVVLNLEYPDDPGAVLGRHTMVRHSGPDWGRMSAFDQRREELNDRSRCPDEKLIDIRCDLHRVSRVKPA